MNRDDAETYFSRISATLSSLQLDWVVDQVNEQIRFGKVGKTEQVTTYKDQESEDQPRQNSLIERGQHPLRGRKEKFPVVKPYTSQEKLHLLIDAVERLFIETADIHNEVAKFVAKEGTGERSFSGMVFVTEDDGHETLSITGTNIDSRILAVRELKPLLDRLRRDVNQDGG